VRPKKTKHFQLKQASVPVSQTNVPNRSDLAHYFCSAFT